MLALTIWPLTAWVHKAENSLRVTHNFRMKSSVSLSLAIMSAKICCTPVSISWSAESPLGEGLGGKQRKNYRLVFLSR